MRSPAWHYGNVFISGLYLLGCRRMVGHSAYKLFVGVCFIAATLGVTTSIQKVVFQIVIAARLHSLLSVIKNFYVRCISCFLLAFILLSCS
jgi:hypothetical protein